MLLNSDSRKLLSRNICLQITQIIQVTPFDDNSEKLLDEFKETYIADNKHIDTNVSADFIVKLMKDGRQVDGMVVVEDGITVPK